MPTTRGLVVVAVAGMVGWGAGARADVDVKFGGQIASDMRFRLGGRGGAAGDADRDGAVSVAAAPAARTAFRATRT